MSLLSPKTRTFSHYTCKLSHIHKNRADSFLPLPQVMVIACCDSRVDPALLMGAGPGDIFTVRNIANLVPPFERQGSYHGTSAALEYAVCSLKVEHISARRAKPSFIMRLC